MKLVSWNGRGMNAVLKRAMLKDVFKTVKGEFLFLEETKMEVINDVVVCSLSISGS